MIVKIYNNYSNINVINKKIEFLKEIKFTFKDDSDITTPILLLKTYIEGNYCYIPDLKRYYYIDKIELMSNGIYKLYLIVDVLMSFKTEILNSNWRLTDSDNFIIKNDIDYNSLINYDQFLLIVGG